MDKVSILIVDDNKVNLKLLSELLKRQGYGITTADNGMQALEILADMPFDLILLDILMPLKNGYQVLEELKSDRRMRHIPVIMITTVDEIESVAKCIEMGADDYLPKPFNRVLLQARIGACLNKKRLRDQEQDYLKRLRKEQEKSDFLLLNILPESVAARLKQNQNTIADYFDDATVLFSDIVNFSRLSHIYSPGELVEFLNEIFSIFDELARMHGVEKIKTIGDSYMVAGGIPVPTRYHAEAVAEMALDMQKAVLRFKARDGENIAMRIGISSGPVLAGVIGTKKFCYDLWGETVNMASRMESHGVPGGIQATESTFNRLKDSFSFTKREESVLIKGKGYTDTYFLTGRL